MVDEAGKRTGITYEWQVLCLVSFVSGISLADWTGVNVVLPVMIKEFNGSTSMLVWTVNAYLVAFAASVIALGRLADIIGRRKTILAGTLIFAAALIATGLSTNFAMLITARAVCGLSSATVAVVSLSVVSSSFPESRRGTAISVWVAVGAFAAALGPLVGGLFTDLLSWRWFFLTNGALNAIGLVFLWFILRESKDESAGRIDVPGVLLLSAALLLLVAGLQFVEQFGWLSPWVIGGVAGGLALLIVFYRVERKVASPLVDFSLFTGRINFLGACIAMFLARFPNGALPLFLALYLQHVLGLSAIETGALFLVMLIPFGLSSFVVARVMEPVGPRLLLAISMAILALGFVSLGYAHPDAGFGVMLLGLALFGIGQGLAYNVVSTIGMSSIPDEKSGAASGILQSVSCISLSLGVAITGAFFKTTENDRLDSLFNLAGGRLGSEARSDIQGMLSGSDAARDKLAALVPAVAERVDLVVDEAFSHSFRDIMFLFIAISAFGFISAFVLGHQHHPDIAKAKNGRATEEH